MTKRLIIFTKDVVRLTGFSLRKAQSLVQEIKFVLEKDKNSFLTVKEFALHMGIDAEDIVLDRG